MLTTLDGLTTGSGYLKSFLDETELHAGAIDGAVPLMEQKILTPLVMLLVVFLCGKSLRNHFVLNKMKTEV